MTITTLGSHHNKCTVLRNNPLLKSHSQESPISAHHSTVETALEVGSTTAPVATFLEKKSLLASFCQVGTVLRRQRRVQVARSVQVIILIRS